MVEEQEAKKLSGREGREAVASKIKNRNAEPKKPRKKYTKKAKPPVTVDPEASRKSAEQFVKYAVAMPCNTLAKRLDPFLKQMNNDPDYTFALSEDENNMWIESTAGLIETLDFTTFAKYMPYIAFAFTAISTAVPRGMAIYSLNKAFKKSEPKDDNTESGQPNNDNGNQG